VEKGLVREGRGGGGWMRLIHKKKKAVYEKTDKGERNGMEASGK